MKVDKDKIGQDGTIRDRNTESDVKKDHQKSLGSSANIFKNRCGTSHPESGFEGHYRLMLEIYLFNCLFMKVLPFLRQLLICFLSLELYFGGPLGIQHFYSLFLCYSPWHTSTLNYILFYVCQHSLNQIVLHRYRCSSRQIPQLFTKLYGLNTISLGSIKADHLNLCRILSIDIKIEIVFLGLVYNS